MVLCPVSVKYTFWAALDSVMDMGKIFRDYVVLSKLYKDRKHRLKVLPFQTHFSNKHVVQFVLQKTRDFFMITFNLT